MARRWLEGPGATGAVLVGLVLAWELGVRWSGVAIILLPAPSAIARELAAAPLFFLREGWFTLLSTVAGFALAVVLGVGLAVAIVCSQILERVIWTVLVVLNSLPKVALAPAWCMDRHWSSGRLLNDLSCLALPSVRRR